MSPRLLTSATALYGGFAWLQEFLFNKAKRSGAFSAKEIWRVSTALSALPDRNTSVRVLKTGEGNSDVRTKKHPKPKRNHTYEQANPNLK